MTNNVDALLDTAFYDYNNADYALAEQKVRQALLLSPTHGDALFLLGLIAYKKGVWSEAIDVLSLLISLYPDHSNYRLVLAEVYQNHGDYEKAKQLYLNEAKNPLAMAEVGWIELEQGNKKEARAIFRKNHVPRSFLGLAELSQGTQRLTYLQKAFDVDPTPVTIRALALYYLQEQDYKKARIYVQKLPDDKFVQALWLRSQHQEAEAIDLLKKLTIEKAFVWENWFELGKTAESANDVSLAESAYRRVLDLKKEALEACQRLARLLMKEGRLSEAVDLYQKLARENPQNPEMLLAIATILEGLGETSEALGLYFDLLSLGQKGFSSNIEQLILKLAKTDKETALRFGEGWVKHFPKNKTAQKVLKALKVILLFICLWAGMAKAQMPLPDSDLNLLWQSKMAASGDPASQYELAEIYEYGKGVPKSLPKAIHYYQLSAAQNYLPSALQLGRLFAHEKAVLDKEKSLQWYIYAANRGEMQAANYLFHYYDESVPPNKQQAFYWLEKMLKSVFPGESDLARVSADYERLKKELVS